MKEGDFALVCLGRLWFDPFFFGFIFI